MLVQSVMSFTPPSNAQWDLQLATQLIQSVVWKPVRRKAQNEDWKCLPTVNSVGVSYRIVLSLALTPSSEGTYFRVISATSSFSEIYDWLYSALVVNASRTGRSEASKHLRISFVSFTSNEGDGWMYHAFTVTSNFAHWSTINFPALPNFITTSFIELMLCRSDVPPAFAQCFHHLLQERAPVPGPWLLVPSDYSIIGALSIYVHVQHGPDDCKHPYLQFLSANSEFSARKSWFDTPSEVLGFYFAYPSASCTAIEFTPLQPRHLERSSAPFSSIIGIIIILQRLNIVSKRAEPWCIPQCFTKYVSIENRL